MLDLAFNRFSKEASRVARRPLSFALAVTINLGWLIGGPLSGFSDSWQLVINTATTIATFAMVFLLQNTQNRDTEASLSRALRGTCADRPVSWPCIRARPGAWPGRHMIVRARTPSLGDARAVGH